MPQARGAAVTLRVRAVPFSNLFGGSDKRLEGRACAQVVVAVHDDSRQEVVTRMAAARRVADATRRFCRSCVSSMLQ